MLLNLIFLFFIFNLVYPYEQIECKNPSVIVFEYSNNIDQSMSIQINGNKYRESSITNGKNGLFAISVKPGIYNINNSQIKSTVYPGQPYKNNNFNLKDIVIKSKWTDLSNTIFSLDKSSFVYIVTMANFKCMNLKSQVNFRLQINNIPIHFEKLSYQQNFIYFNKLFFEAGSYVLSLQALSDSDFCCSCMSEKDGFKNGRYLLAWQEIKTKQDNKIYTESIIVKENIKQNIYYDSNTLNVSSIYNYIGFHLS